MKTMKDMKEIIQNKAQDAPATSKEADRGLLVVRIGLGLFFIYYGLGLFFGFAPDGGIDQFTGTLGVLGFPAPLFWAYLVAFVELFGGITILLGFFTRISSLVLAVIPLVAFIIAADTAFGAGGQDVLAFAMAVALMLAGPGRLSFAERWYQEEIEGPVTLKDTVAKEEKAKEEEKQKESDKIDRKDEKDEKAEARDQKKDEKQGETEKTDKTEKKSNGSEVKESTEDADKTDGKKDETREKEDVIRL